MDDFCSDSSDSDCMVLNDECTVEVVSLDGDSDSEATNPTDQSKQASNLSLNVDPTILLEGDKKSDSLASESKDSDAIETTVPSLSKCPIIKGQESLEEKYYKLLVRAIPTEPTSSKASPFKSDPLFNSLLNFSVTKPSKKVPKLKTKDEASTSKPKKKSKKKPTAEKKKPPASISRLSLDTSPESISISYPSHPIPDASDLMGMIDHLDCSQTQELLTKLFSDSSVALMAHQMIKSTGLEWMYRNSTSDHNPTLFQHYHESEESMLHRFQHILKFFITSAKDTPTAAATATFTALAWIHENGQLPDNLVGVYNPETPNHPENDVTRRLPKGFMKEYKELLVKYESDLKPYCSSETMWKNRDLQNPDMAAIAVASWSVAAGLNGKPSEASKVKITYDDIEGLVNNKKAAVETMFAVHQAEINRLNLELQFAKSEVHSVIADLEKKNADLHYQIQKASDNIETLKTEKENLSINLNEAVANKFELNDKIDELNTIVKVLHEDLAKKTEVIDATLKEKQKIEEELDYMKKVEATIVIRDYFRRYQRHQAAQSSNKPADSSTPEEPLIDTVNPVKATPEEKIEQAQDILESAMAAPMPSSNSDASNSNPVVLLKNSASGSADISSNQGKEKSLKAFSEAEQVFLPPINQPPKPFKTEYDELMDSFKNLQKEYQIAENLRQTCATINGELLQKNEALKAELLASKEDLLKAHRALERQSMDSGNDDPNQEMNRIKTQLTHMQMQNACLKAQIQDLKASEAKLKNLEAMNLQLKAGIDAHKQMITQRDADLKKAYETCENLQQICNRSQESMLDLEKMNNFMCRQLDEHHDDFEALHTKYTKQSDDLCKANQSIIQLGLLKDQNERKVRELESQKSTIEAVLRQMEEDEASMKTKYAEHLKQIENVKVQLEFANKTMNFLKQKEQDATKKSETLEKDLTLTQQKAKYFENLATNLSEALNKNRVAEKLQKDLADANEKLSKAQAALKEAEDLKDLHDVIVL